MALFFTLLFARFAQVLRACSCPAIRTGFEQCCLIAAALALLAVSPQAQASDFSTQGSVKLTEAEIIKYFSGMTLLYEDGAHEHFAKQGSAYLNQKGALSYHRWYANNDQLCYLGVGQECWNVYMNINKQFYLRRDKAVAVIRGIYAGDPFNSRIKWGNVFQASYGKLNKQNASATQQPMARAPQQTTQPLLTAYDAVMIDEQADFFQVEPATSPTPILEPTTTQTPGNTWQEQATSSTDYAEQAYKLDENGQLADGSLFEQERLIFSNPKGQSAQNSSASIKSSLDDGALIDFGQGNAVAAELFGNATYAERLAPAEMNYIQRLKNFSYQEHDDPGCFVHNAICVSDCQQKFPDKRKNFCTSACEAIYLCAQKTN